LPEKRATSTRDESGRNGKEKWRAICGGGAYRDVDLLGSGDLCGVTVLER
jgi:hypothetical protein